MNLEHFDYHLPSELIAQEPVTPRHNSRLFVYNRAQDTILHEHFYDLPKHLTEQDVLVLNNTKVFPARLYAHKKTGGKVEIFLLRQHGEGMWQVMLGGGGRKKVGMDLKITDEFICTVAARSHDNVWLVQFNQYGKDFWRFVYAYGQVPLPPYIKKPTTLQEYQTAFAQHTGSVAAPTAGFHFTDELLGQLRQQGVGIEYVTLHVGLGTFLPVTENEITKHHMHAEWGEIATDTAYRLNQARDQGKRIIAVGSTATRTLEAFADDHGQLTPQGEWIDLFIYPGYQYKAVDGMITNFHLPKSTLIMLVAAFLSQQKNPQDGIKLVQKMYTEAVQRQYRFYSFGDGMLLL